MKTKKQFLTKSRFKVGYECPTKLFYLDDKSYGNNNIDNSFLAALAEGGFQVGELAKLYYPGGTEITVLDKEAAADQTAKLLQQERAIIYEAAFKHRDLFIKADIVIKNGSSIELIEVKAKSFDSAEEDPFYNKSSLKKGTPKISSSWEPYLIDVAFQTHVVKKCFPHLTVTSALMLADKTATATVDGLNQLFFLEKSENGRARVRLAEGITQASLGDKILVKVNVDSEVKIVWGMTFDNGKTFEQTVSDLSGVCAEHQFIKPVLGGHCKSCEFRIGDKQKSTGLKSGFEHCWTTSANLKLTDFNKAFVFDIWNFRKSQKLLEDGKIFVDQLEAEDISPSSNSEKPGLSSSERQWLQVEKIKTKDFKPFLDVDGLRSELREWKFPLHFIDFETTMVAIPFHKGRRPYEQIAFQFSHHIRTEDGRIVHQDEYINRLKGRFPNFEFVRALKKALGNDQGTIFRYAAHENTVLCQIKNQLETSEEAIADREDLITFIKTITASTGGNSEKWEGARNMVDMCELVKKYFYHPQTNGSNSIKKVLPAVLTESMYLQERFSKPIYGTDDVISKNYKSWCWIEKDVNGKVIDPYKRLPPVFSDLDLETMDSLVTEGSIADGGAAMTAYSRMQFTEMSEEESEKVAKALLKYCELDTFAMVLLFEYWKHEIDAASARKVA